MYLPEKHWLACIRGTKFVLFEAGIKLLYKILLRVSLQSVTAHMNTHKENCFLLQSNLIKHDPCTADYYMLQHRMVALFFLS
jgi:hypothetical protein